MRIYTSLGLLGSAAILASACASPPDSGEQTSESSEALSLTSAAPAVSTAARSRNEQHDRDTRSPIKHVIVIVGENRTFDHVFATYKPKHGQRIDNLLSKGIIKESGEAGPNFSLAVQQSAVDSSTFALSPGGKTPYEVLPTALAGGPTDPFVETLADAKADEGNALPANYLQFLTTGGTGLQSGSPETRLPNPSALPPGPFQLTPAIGYDDYSASPVHRFYQMWQELDCNLAFATWQNPSGCREDLFPWVEVTVGAGANGATRPANYNEATTQEGSTAMGFYNVLKGDAPYFKSLADEYAMSDNFHQSIQGGTGANHVALGTGDADWFSDGKGNPLAPPTLNTENPNPQAGTNNWYTQDGYSGGTYSDCSDASQPGVGPVLDYLHDLHVKPNCEKGHYYLLNNYDPGYFGDGTVNTGEFVIPPSSTRTIGDELLEHQVSWRYYGENWNKYVADPDGFAPGDEYCNICNPFQYSTSIMTNAAVRTSHLKDTDDFYEDVKNGWLPAFSIIKPSGLLDGHPASSKLDLFEGFSKKVVDAVKSHPELFADTAIFITFDEGGGYYDSGYIQPVDFFGDGTRIPLIAVSPYATGGYLSHQYADHVSILKFVERNWRLDPITRRSRDNLPNPIADRRVPWVPRNSPALDDLFDLFDFAHRDADQDTDPGQEWSFNDR
jgi:phospholipase C